MRRRVEVLYVDQRRGRARFRYLDGDSAGKCFATQWDPREGEQSFAVGDVVELVKVSE